MTTIPKIPKQTQVAIIGGGIGGVSLAYQLTKLGITDVALLDRKSLASGTTYHAAGMIRELQATESTSWMSRQTNKIYAQLQEETGINIHYRQVGSLYVSNHLDRIEEFKYSFSKTKSFGVESHLLTKEEIKSLWPMINNSDLLGGYFMPNDSVVNPYQATLALVKAAKNRGAKIFENTKVNKITRKNGTAVGIHTDMGYIQADYIVICGGIWSRDFAKPAEVNIPLHACEHYYILTEALNEVELSLPAMRDFEARCYVRPAAGTYWDDGGKRLMCGFFEPQGKPWGMDGIPEDFEFAKLGEDWEHLKQVLINVKHRIPVIKDAKVELFFNGPESFTYDNSYFIGEAPNLKNLYIATGLCSRGIQAAGGIGLLIANRIANGISTLDVDTVDVDIRRCAPFTANKKFLHDRVIEGLGMLFDMQYPYRQFYSAREIRKTPLHDRLELAGACFGEAAGWERANFYIPNLATNQKATYTHSFSRQNWHKHNAREHKCTRENVSIFDLTSFVKILLQGRDALKLLNQICGAQIDVEIGKIVYTQALNERGGIEADWTITRIDHDAFWIISAVGSQQRDYHFINSHISHDIFATITDITSSHAVLGIMGPNSRKLIQQLSPDNFSNEAFPLYSSKIIDFGYARARANRISFVGELGWEIFLPTEFTLNCYDQLIEVGKCFDLQHAGYHTLNSMRLEKAYRHWGDDISDVDTPIEAGLDFALDFNKPEFNGRERLLQQKTNGVKKCLACFLVDPTCEATLHHHEPIFKDGAQVGYISSGMYCHSLKRSIGLGYIHSDKILNRDNILSGQYEIELFAKKYPAEVTLASPYDPKNEKMKG